MKEPWFDKLRLVFSFSKHSYRVWTQLDKLGMPSREITLIYYHSASKKRALDRFLTDDLYFLEWGAAVLNPMLNHHLKRGMDKPTFQNMMLHLLKEELKRQEEIMKWTKPKVRPDHPDYRKWN